MRTANLFDKPAAEETSDDDACICPYCAHKTYREAEDVDEGERVEECYECGKKYHRHEYISITTHCRPDCALNGEEHKWALHDYGKGSVYIICDGCGKHDIRRPENGRGES